MNANDRLSMIVLRSTLTLNSTTSVLQSYDCHTCTTVRLLRQESSCFSTHPPPSIPTHPPAGLFEAPAKSPSIGKHRRDTPVSQRRHDARQRGLHTEECHLRRHVVYYLGNYKNRNRVTPITREYGMWLSTTPLPPLRFFIISPKPSSYETRRQLSRAAHSKQTSTSTILYTHGVRHGIAVGFWKSTFFPVRKQHTYY